MKEYLTSRSFASETVPTARRSDSGVSENGVSRVMAL